MKILELCPFSSGICGVFTRAFSESKEFVNLGHQVLILSSDIEKGTNRVNPIKSEKIDGIEIRRFPSKNDFLDNWLSDNVIYWLNEEVVNQIITFNPDVIITHLLHPHSAYLSKIIPDLKKANPNIKILIVPHAPFNVKRRFPLNLATFIWRKFSRLRLNKFDKVIAITQWEIPYLKKLGVSDENIAYIPNGLPDEFFRMKIKKPEKDKDVLFLGRIAPVKNLETFLKAAEILPEFAFSIVGSQETNYLNNLEPQLKKLANVIICPPIYDLKSKINFIDEHKIFVLPSIREAMPQVLIEALARGKIVISSDTDGGKEIIENGVNGFIFPIGDYSKLAELIRANIKGNGKIQKKAVEFSKDFAWSKLIKRYINIFL